MLAKLEQLFDKREIKMTTNLRLQSQFHTWHLELSHVFNRFPLKLAEWFSPCQGGVVIIFNKMSHFLLFFRAI